MLKILWIFRSTFDYDHTYYLTITLPTFAKRMMCSIWLYVQNIFCFLNGNFQPCCKNREGGVQEKSQVLQRDIYEKVNVNRFIMGV